MLVCLSKANSQAYYFRHYQVENGLSNSAVICTLQDSKGFMWFGTKDGLNRFDGYSFKIFRNIPNDTTSIGSNFIRSLFEDAYGVLWVATERGLYQYNADKERFSLLTVTANNLVNDVCKDHQNNLWFIMGATLFKYKEAIDNKPINYTKYPVGATSICVSPDGDFWASTGDGKLEKYNYQTNRFTEYNVFINAPQSTHWIQKIYPTSTNTILIGTATQGVKLFDVATNTYQDIFSGDANHAEIFVRNFVEVSPSKYWIATESGIFVYHTDAKSAINLQKEYNNPYSITDNAVYCFCKDKEGGIWAGTYFGGINYYSKPYTPFNKLFPKTGENGLSGNVVREIHQDQTGNLWIGTEDAGLNKMDAATGKFTCYKPSANTQTIAYTNIHGLLVNGNDLWIGTFEHGLDVMDIKTGLVKKHYRAGIDKYHLHSDFIYCLAKTHTNDIIIGTTIGAYKYNTGKDDFSLLDGMPLNNWYSYLLQDNEGTIWAATYGNGIYYYNTKTKMGGNFRYSAANSKGLPNDRVNSIFEDSKHQIWFATESGLCKFNAATKSFITYTTADGLPSNFVLSILEDEKNNLWLSTSKGLVRFNPMTNRMQVYTTVNGLLNDQFNFNSAYKDANGRMYFGSVKGMISFNPKEFVDNNFVPPIYITGLQVFNKDIIAGEEGSPLSQSIINTKKITLNHNQSTLSIDFAALGYAAPEMTEYAYKMEGLDNNWTYLKTNRKAYFTDLSTGTYIFKVKAITNAGLLAGIETSLEIEILPPWWLSTWAYSIYILLVVLIIYAIIWYYQKSIEAKNKQRFELFEKAKEKEVFEAKMSFFTNVAHEVKTHLTLIKAPLEKVIKKGENTPDIMNYLRVMERNTNRLVDLSNQLLDFRQTEILGFSLNFSEVDITALLEETYSSFKPVADEKKLNFKLRLLKNNIIAYADIDAVDKILYNIVGNAVKYAATTVSIELESIEKDNYFTITIKNDGFVIPEAMSEKVFQPFFRLKETEKQKGTGIGLAISRSLVQLHNGTLALDKSGDGKMNVFVLKLPVKQ